MEYTVDSNDGVKVVHLQGPVDVSQAVALRDVLGAEINGPAARVLVDLSDVPLIDSSGIGVMVTAHRRADGTGAGFALAAPGPTVARVFSLTRTDKLLRLYTTVGEGVEALRTA
jgi:anti-sigma B factor antagonist